MIKHIVCHAIKNPDDAQRAADMLNALTGRIPTLKNMCAGVDALHSQRSYELGIVAEFEDLDALHEYDIHPEHAKIKAFIASVKDNERPSVAVDFEF